MTTCHNWKVKTGEDLQLQGACFWVMRLPCSRAELCARLDGSPLGGKVQQWEAGKPLFPPVLATYCISNIYSVFKVLWLSRQHLVTFDLLDSGSRPISCIRLEGGAASLCLAPRPHAAPMLPPAWWPHSGRWADPWPGGSGEGGMGRLWPSSAPNF